jgi:hypothetical protein
MYVPTTFDVSNNIYCMCKLYRNGLSVSEYGGLILRGGGYTGGRVQGVIFRGLQYITIQRFIYPS